MFEPCRAARKRVSNLAREAAEEFDETLLHNRVYEGVQGQHDKHNDLLRLLDLTERTYDLSADRDDQGDRLDIFGAAEELNDKVDDLVDEEVAKACAAVVDAAADWTDDEAEAADAKHEAREWLQDHHAAAECAGVAEEVFADA